MQPFADVYPLQLVGVAVVVTVVLVGVAVVVTIVLEGIDAVVVTAVLVVDVVVEAVTNKDVAPVFVSPSFSNVRRHDTKRRPWFVEFALHSW